MNPKYVAEFEAAGMKFVGRDTENVRMEVMELSNHPYYVAVQGMGDHCLFSITSLMIKIPLGSGNRGREGVRG